MKPIYKEFLWLPKIINGKWYWLRNVNYHKDYSYMTIGGKLVVINVKKYLL